MNDAGRDHPHCAECGASRPDSWILHNVSHKSNYRLLCTHCLLASFRGHFCHHCFDVFLPLNFPYAPRTSQRVLCLHCPTISNLSCVNPGPNSNPNSAASSDQFRCPVCADPEFRFFRMAIDEGGKRVVKREGTKAVIAAARIAAETIRKGAATARVEADKRVKEAAVVRKRARVALERVAYLSMKDKEKKGIVRGSGVSNNGKEGNEKESKVAKLNSNERSNDVEVVELDSHHHSVNNGVNNGAVDVGSKVTPKQWLQVTPGPKKEINDGRGHIFSGAVEFWWVNDLWLMLVVEWMVL